MTNKIKDLYNEFFSNLNINENTGELKDYPDLKFATFPYVGSNYESAKKKILFVGLDIGRDETPGYIQSLEERRMNIANQSNFNPHIAGTYTTSLYFLKDDYSWSNIWEVVKSHETCQRATKTINHVENQNPLTYIALTNYFKFVTIDRINRTGDLNRSHLSKKTEEDLFLSEIKVLNPDIVIFQGNMPINEVVEEIKKSGVTIYKAAHPANRKRNGRQPENYIKNIIKV